MQWKYLQTLAHTRVVPTNGSHTKVSAVTFLPLAPKHVKKFYKHSERWTYIYMQASLHRLNTLLSFFFLQFSPFTNYTAKQLSHMKATDESVWVKCLPQGNSMSASRDFVQTALFQSRDIAAHKLGNFLTAMLTFQQKIFRMYSYLSLEPVQTYCTCKYWMLHRSGRQAVTMF